jgi:ABC-2 type transport system ATP-binding protein
MEPTLIAEHLTKRIGKRTIVDDVSFALMPGEVYGFLGPNGAGKTTTIRMLVGLIRPTAGAVRICGHDVAREFESATRCIGCIVETPDLYRFMTGRENLEHFARMLGGVEEGQIAEIADRVALGHRLDDRVRTYSLGMRQRLGIAQALLGSPRLLILDEPANGLDPAGIREMRHLLRELAASGMTIFVSSHLLAEVELMCDRVAIIHRGKLLRSGTVAELISRRRETIFRVDPVDRAREIASRAHRIIDGDGDRLVVMMDDEAVPHLVAEFVSAGIAVRETQPRLLTLEEMFLEITGHETVGD